MFPGFTKNNIVDYREVNSVLLCKSTLGTHDGNIGAFDFYNLCLSKFSQIMFGTTEAAALIYHILGVIGGASKKQMCWSYAERVVTIWAIMANRYAIRYFTVSKFPGPAVGVNAYGFTIDPFDSIPVTILAGAALPQPTLTVCFINVAPEGFLCGNLTDGMTVTATKLTVPVSDAIRANVKRFAAGLASGIRFFRTTAILAGFRTVFAASMSNSRAVFQKVATAKQANTLDFERGNGIMRLHRNSPFCVTPPVTPITRGLYVAKNLPQLYQI